MPQNPEDRKGQGMSLKTGGKQVCFSEEKAQTALKN
jgi:hypothetical protein